MFSDALTSLENNSIALNVLEKLKGLTIKYTDCTYIGHAILGHFSIVSQRTEKNCRK